LRRNEAYDVTPFIVDYEVAEKKLLASLIELSIEPPGRALMPT